MTTESLGKTPISESNPAGNDVIYEPEFEQLQQEIDKLSIASTQSDGTDWDKVVNLSKIILKEKSKNLLVAVYLAEGLIKTKDFEGFLEGSIIISDLVENFWDSFYPAKKRKKGRINAIRWWYDKADTFFKSFPENLEITREDSDALKKAVKNIDSIFSEKLDDAPLLRPIIQKIERIPLKKEAVKEEEKPKETEASKNSEELTAPQADKPQKPQQSKQPAVGSHSSQSVSEIGSDKDAIKVFNQGVSTLIKTGNYLFAKNLSNPLPYKISRLYTWGTLEQLPMIEEGQKTVLPPPEPKIKSSLETMMNGKEFENVISTAEKSLRDYIFWLDLNRFSALALDEMGPRYEKAKITVELETAQIIKKFHNIENLLFSDGTPFADNETKAWLKTIAASDGEPDDSISSSGDETYSKVLETEKNAKKLLREKKAFEAVSLFEKGLVQSESQREKIIFRIFLSKFFIEMGKPEFTTPHLKKIEENIDKFMLETFEPKIAVNGLSIIYKVYSESSDESLKEKSMEYLNRISTINPAAAFKLGV